MFGFALAFCAGAAALLALPALWPAPAAAAPAVAAALLLRRRPLFAAALAGFAWTHSLATVWLASGWPCSWDREAVAISGTVAAPPIEREGRIDFDLDVMRAPGSGPAPRRVRLSWYETDRRPAPGECWRLDVRLRCRRGFANAGAQDRELDLLRDRIDATGYVVGKSVPERLSRPSGRPVEALRARIAGGIAAAVAPGPSVAVLQGLSVGVRGSIPDRLWDAFAKTGIAHLVAISGMHVTGCAIFVLALLRLAWRLPALASVKMRVAIECMLVVAVTAAYAFIAGASLPALRTLAMVSIFAWLRWLRRSLPLHGVLSLAALVLVAGDPLALISAGFWLSFVATAALLAVLTRETGWRGHLAGFARTQLAITALLTPVLTAAFGRVSLVAPAANAIAIPVFSLLLLPAVLLGTVLAPIAPAAAASVWRALAWLLDRGWPVLETVAAWPAASWSPAVPSPWLIAAAAAVPFAALLLPLYGLRCAAAVLLVSVTLGRAERPPSGAFELTAVDVGQGLSVVLETAHHVLVFDTGPRWRGSGAAARVSLLPYLRARGIRRIDRLVVSHDDLDHAGGVELLQRSLRVARMMKAPGSHLAADEVCTQGEAWRWDGVSFLVLHPPAAFQGSDNDRSCVLLAAGPGGSALLLADPESAAESALVALPVAADVVLLPHHGSRSSSSPALVGAVSARIGIASAGFGNRWGMPDGDVVARWRAAGTTVLVTADEGAIRVRFPQRAGGIKVATERRGGRRWWRGG